MVEARSNLQELEPFLAYTYYRGVNHPTVNFASDPEFDASNPMMDLSANSQQTIFIECICLSDVPKFCSIQYQCGHNICPDCHESYVQ